MALPPERLKTAIGSGLLSFPVTHFSDDGGFEINNLMRGNDTLPVAKLRAVIDRDLYHRPPGRIPAGDVVELG